MFVIKAITCCASGIWITTSPIVYYTDQHGLCSVLFTWHYSLHYLFLQALGSSLVSSWCDHSMLASLLWRCLNCSLLTPALLRTHSSVFFAVHETRRIFVSLFISKASRLVSSFFLRVQLSQPYTLLQTTLVLSWVVACEMSCMADEKKINKAIVHCGLHPRRPTTLV